MEIQNVTKGVSRPAAAEPLEAGRAGGFSLIELMMTIAVAVILMMIAIPSFQYVTNANRISSEVNGLLGDLQFARAEAIKEGQYVSVCASTDGASCSGDAADWQGGWIVFANPNNSAAVTPGVAVTPVLRIQSKFSSTDTFTATNAQSIVTFNRDGYALGIANGTLITLHDSTSNKAWTRCASIAPSGAVITELYGIVNNGATCT
jgi:type IV fimbrial biogenesis protein FimT